MSHFSESENLWPGVSQMWFFLVVSLIDVVRDTRSRFKQSFPKDSPFCFKPGKIVEKTSAILIPSFAFTDSAKVIGVPSSAIPSRPSPKSSV